MKIDRKREKIVDKQKEIKEDTKNVCDMTLTKTAKLRVQERVGNIMKCYDCKNTIQNYNGLDFFSTFSPDPPFLRVLPFFICSLPRTPLLTLRPYIHIYMYDTK